MANEYYAFSIAGVPVILTEAEKRKAQAQELIDKYLKPKAMEIGKAITEEQIKKYLPIIIVSICGIIIFARLIK